MSLYGSIQISSQGLTVQRQRMQLIASNLANISTTRSAEGGPYQRRQLIVEARPADDFKEFLDGFMNEEPQQHDIMGVKATEIVLDQSPFVQKYQPDHPEADQNGYVSYPNVNPAIEMVDMVSVTRSFEANVTAIRTSKDMISQVVELLRV